MKLFANIFVYKSLLVILPHLLASCFTFQRGTYTFLLTESRKVVYSTHDLFIIESSNVLEVFITTFTFIRPYKINVYMEDHYHIYFLTVTRICIRLTLKISTLFSMDGIMW